LHRTKSETALARFPDAYFDWVYLDGNHYYEYVLRDLEICVCKVRRRGIIAGDDYTWGEEHGFPVKKAVDSFLQAKNLQNNINVIGSQFMIVLQ
jgi:hypothetical protein